MSKRKKWADRDQYFTKPELRKRGWTDTLIERFLSEPDESRPNPDGGQMALYLRSRVLTEEESKAFQESKAKRAERKKTELRAVAHSIVPGATIIEVWHDGQFIATVAGADGPGVGIISKYPMQARLVEGLPAVLEVKIEPK
jgi:hypothetical protein